MQSDSLCSVLFLVTQYKKVQINFALEQAMKDQRGSRGIVLHFL